MSWLERLYNAGVAAIPERGFGHRLLQEHAPDVAYALGPEGYKDIKRGIRRYAGPHLGAGINSVLDMVPAMMPSQDVVDAAQGSRMVTDAVREGDWRKGVEGGSLMGAALLASTLPVSAAMFAGPGAKTANMGMLKRAEDMKAGGKSAREIWDETGWFEGADGKWRFEIDDSNSRFTADEAMNRKRGELQASAEKVELASMIRNRAENRGISVDAAASSISSDLGREIPADVLDRAQRHTGEALLEWARSAESALTDVREDLMLPQALEHDSLFDAYPSLGGIRYTGQGTELGFGGLASYDAPAREIAVSTYSNNPQRRSSLLHEVQHAVQDTEKLAYGGNTFQGVADDLKAVRAEKMELYNYLDERGRFDSINEFNNSPQGRRLTGREQMARNIEMAEGINDQELLKYFRLVQEEGRLEDLGLDNYKRLAGEVEARNVQARRDMTPAERRATPPWETEDVPRDRQIVRFNSSGPAASIPMDEASRKGIRAYHGSPHDFDKFDMNKIGTGEGAQAYGHGLYFAENEGVARDYRNKLARDRATIGDLSVDTTRRPQEAVDAWRAASSSLPEDVRRSVSEKIQNRLNANEILDDIDIDFYGEHTDAVADILKSVPGRMYEVNINADPDDFLDWDKPLSEQSDVVKNHFRHLKTDFDGSELARRIESDIWRDEAIASGIPGIKYLDQGSRAAGEGSRNYVVFDDKIIDILKKYGLPISMAPLVAAQLAGEDSENGL